MPLEAGDHIPELNANNPLGADPKSEGDDHLRLVKRCVLGSFPGFVGNAGAPKSVSLTEDQINDAALKSAAQVITGTWNFQADQIFNNNTELQGFLADGITPSNMVRISTGNFFRMGSALAESVMTTLSEFFVQIGAGLDNSAVFRANSIGGFTIFDRADNEKLAGFRNPASNVQNASYTLQQSDEGQIVHFVAGLAAQVYTVPTLETGTTMTIINDDTVDSLILRESGVALSFLTGGTQINAAPDLTMAPNSVVQLHWFDAVTVKMWGNGIS